MRLKKNVSGCRTAGDEALDVVAPGESRGQSQPEAVPSWWKVGQLELQEL